VKFVPAPHKGQLCLVAHDKAAFDFMKQVRDAEPLELEPLFERDMIEHRKVFAQINEVAKALHITPECLRARLLFETGNFTVLGEMYGKTFVAVSSMSRHAMRDHELHTFWAEAKEVVKTKLLSNVSDPAERESLAAMLSEVG
jgi:hypothetical protein